MPDHYANLGLDPKNTITTEDIKKAFRKLAMQWHPDKQATDKKALAEENFQKAHKAYTFLIEHKDDENAGEILYQDLMGLINNWPSDSQTLAKENLKNNNIYQNLKRLIKKKRMHLSDFAYPIDPLVWQLFLNEHFVHYQLHKSTDAPALTCLSAFLMNTDPTKHHMTPLSPERLTITEVKFFWLYMAADTELRCESSYEDSPYLYKLKWRLIRENIDEYVTSNGNLNANFLLNVLSFFGGIRPGRCGRYINTTYNNLILPLENKITKFRTLDDPISIEKADQIEMALAELKNRLTLSITSFLQLNREHRITQEEELNQLPLLNDIVINTISTLSNAQTINQRRNLIGDILKCALGIFISTALAGLPLLSQKFRQTFFKADTKVILENSTHEIRESYIRQNDIHNFHFY